MKIIKLVVVILVSSLVVLLSASVYLSFYYKKNITIQKTIPGQHISVNGTKLRYYQQGQGKDILFLHASIGNLEDFETVLPLLDGFRVTTVDRIGHGYSENNPEGANIEQNARYIQRLVEKLKLNDVIVVGHSYGGSIALKMALNKFKPIKALVLLAPAAYPGHDTRDIEHLFAQPVIGLGLLRILSPLIAEDMLTAGLKQAVYPDSKKLPTDYISNRIKLWNNPGILYARTQQTISFNDEFKEMQSRYKDITKPVVIMLGEKDSFDLIQRDSHRLATEIPLSRLVLLPDSGHYIQYHTPKKVASILREMHN